MPDNNGVYSLPPIYEATPGENILSVQHNVPLRDIAAALNNRLTRDGTSPMQANLPMGNNRLTGLAPAINAGDAPRLDQVTRFSPFLNSASALTLAANEMIYSVGANTAAKTTLTPFARSLLDDLTAEAARITLGLSGAAVLPRANEAQATAGASFDVLMTPLGTQQYVTGRLANMSEAVAGTDPSKLMTPQRVEQHMLAHSLGYGQAYTDVFSTRAADTPYQNATGRVIQIVISFDTFAGGTGSWVDISTDGTSWMPLAGSFDDRIVVSAPIPPGNWYRLRNPENIFSWVELR